ncbi:MAG: HD domain-containing protein [Lentisphaeria bacterium]|nr:HD domain-containing protein [Lentisphaeria bacterium]
MMMVDAFTLTLRSVMEREFGTDRKRIAHALAVLAYAERILREEAAGRKVVVAAALLHDIGIQEAERRHHSNAPKYQELEGPPIARRILDDLRVLEPDDVDHVCRIVGSHHSARGIDTPEFRIVWDADWLVNFRDVYSCEFGSECKTRGKQCADRIARLFRTPAGRRIALAELLPEFAAAETAFAEET